MMNQWDLLTAYEHFAAVMAAGNNGEGLSLCSYDAAHAIKMIAQNKELLSRFAAVNGKNGGGR